MSKEWCYYEIRITSQNPSVDKETSIDTNTLKRFISMALQKYHGLFGQGIEYSIMNHHNQTAFIKVSQTDKSSFASAVTLYVSTEDLYDHPLVALLEQETSNIKNLLVGEDDQLWWRRECEEEEGEEEEEEEDI
ncbi:hypothetical protein ACO0QE_002884 [Hanseniaspora vineae]